MLSSSQLHFGGTVDRLWMGHSVLVSWLLRQLHCKWYCSQSKSDVSRSAGELRDKVDQVSKMQRGPHSDTDPTRTHVKAFLADS